MKTYIKPLITNYHVLSSFHLLAGSPEKAGKALTNDQGLVHNQPEPDIKQLSKGDLFSDYNITDSMTEWSD